MMTDSPNILLILTDQQSATMMGCAGNAYVRTPTMDSLAASGVRFERAYCTNPVCVPSRFSLMTGRMPSAIDLRANEFNHLDDIPAEIKRYGIGWLLRGAGYETVYAGKVHLPKLRPEDVGFDVIETDERDRLADTCAAWLRQPHLDPFFMVASFINPHDICYMSIRESQRNDSERRLVERGVIECQTLDRAIGRPEGMDEETFFATRCPPLPDNFEPQADEPEAMQQLLGQWPFRVMARNEWSERRWREHRWVYARLTEMVDRQIGRVWDALRESGLADNTVVIFTSDHGDMDAAHRMDHKIALYEEACKVPLIITQPGGSQTGTTSEIVSNGLDLLPTICSFADVDVPPCMKGVSLRPFAEDADASLSRNCVPVESEFGRAIVADRYKYVLYDEGARREQLYDLCADPGEMRNAAGDEAHRSALSEMRRRFEQQSHD